MVATATTVSLVVLAGTVPRVCVVTGTTVLMVEDRVTVAVMEEGIAVMEADDMPDTPGMLLDTTMEREVSWPTPPIPP